MSRRVSLEEFSQVLKLVTLKNKKGKLAVGVSGSIESLALLSLLKVTMDPQHLVALTFDPQLNQQGTDYVQSLRDKIEDMGISHHIVKSDWAQTGSGLIGDTLTPAIENPPQQFTKAKVELIRKRRNQAFINACEKFKIWSLAVASTLEDHLHTIARRTHFGSSPLYLSGLPLASTMSLYNKDLRIYRPLLPFPRNQLEGTLKFYGIEPMKEEDIANIQFLDKAPFLKLMQKTSALNATSDSAVAGLVSPQQLLEFSERMIQHKSLITEKVANIIRSDVLFADNSGRALISIDCSKKYVCKHWISNPEIAHAVLTAVIKKVAADTDPDSAVPIAVLERFRLSILDTFTKDMSKRRIIIGKKVCIYPPRASETGYRIWILARQALMGKERRSMYHAVKDNDSLVWDNRFLIKCTGGSKSSKASETTEPMEEQVEQVRIQTLMEEHVQLMMTRLLQFKEQKPEKGAVFIKYLFEYWTKMPFGSRETIAVALVQRGESWIPFAIPSLDINVEPEVMKFETEYVAGADEEEIHFTNSIFKNN